MICIHQLVGTDKNGNGRPLKQDYEDKKVDD